MGLHDLWVLLPDPHERAAVDGVWAFGIADLIREAAAAAPGTREAPCVVTDERLAAVVRAVVPSAVPRVCPPELPLLRLDSQSAAGWGLLELFDLQARLSSFRPDVAADGVIRTYGTRAGILGCAWSASTGIAHHACIVPVPEGRCGPRAEWARVFEQWILSTAEVVETADAACLAALEREHLPDQGRIGLRSHPACEPAQDGSEGRAAADGPVVAVLGSTRSMKADRVVLRALRRVVTRAALADGGTAAGSGAETGTGTGAAVPARRAGIPGRRFTIEWLARRISSTATPVLQEVRRLGIAEHFRWKEEPWADPPSPGRRRWDLLLDLEPCPGPRPIVIAALAAGCEVLAPGSRGDPFNEAAWIEQLSQVLEVSGKHRARRDPHPSDPVPSGGPLPTRKEVIRCNPI